MVPVTGFLHVRKLFLVVCIQQIELLQYAKLVGNAEFSPNKTFVRFKCNIEFDLDLYVRALENR